MTELNWMQEYAAAETIELRQDGLLTRREMLVRLVAICGTVGRGAAFLAACSDDPATAPESPPRWRATPRPRDRPRRRAGPATPPVARIPNVWVRDATFPSRATMPATWRGRAGGRPHPAHRPRRRRRQRTRA